MYKISIDPTSMQEGLSLLLNRFNDKGQWAHTTEAVHSATDEVARTWAELAAGAFQFSTGGYINAIYEGIEHNVGGNPWQSEIVNHHRTAVWLEEGTKSFDMKKALRTSAQTRISKDGKLYMVIPFRHGTPQKQVVSAGGVQTHNRATMPSMPQSVYKQAVKLQISRRTGSFKERAVLHKHLQATRSSYKWGESLKAKTLKTVGVPAADVSRFSGMVRMPRSKSEKGGSQYLTFRVMHEDSPGWIHPATPAMRLAENTALISNDTVTEIIRNGVRQDALAFTSSI